MSGPIPAAALNGQPVRVILHWTAGSHTCSEVDRRHYHFIIDGQGKVHLGRHSIADNASTRDGRYAAHTRGMNTGSVGLSMCGMAGAVQRPFQPGRWPFTQDQWRVAQECAAQLLTWADLPCTPATCFSHFEAQAIHGVAQRGKWDVGVLPWEPGKPPEQVMSEFRDGVAGLLRGAPRLLIDDAEISRALRLEDGQSWLWIRPVAEWLDGSVEWLGGGQVRLHLPELPEPRQLPVELREGQAWIRGTLLAEAIGRQVEWNPQERTLRIFKS